MEVNPTNYLNVVTASAGQNATQIEVDRSTDGGSHWTATFLAGGEQVTDKGSPLGPVTPRFDPVVQFAADGTLYVAYGVHYTGDDDKVRTALMVARMSSGGASFDLVTQVASEEDHTYTPADRNIIESTPLKTAPGLESWQLATGPDGMGGQAIYAAYIQHQTDGTNSNRINSAVHVSASDDGGAHFMDGPSSTNKAANGDDGNARENFAPSLVVGPQGEVYVAWLHHDDLVTSSSTGQPVIGNDSKPRVEKWAINFTSAPQGLWKGAWGNDSEIISDVNHIPEFSPGRAAPALAIDPHSGTLYVAYANGDQNLGILRSTDFGAHWLYQYLDTTATTAAGGYDSGSGTFHIPYVAAADVDPWNTLSPTNPANGAFHAAFVTTNGVRLVTSMDGGQTFSSQDVVQQGGLGGSPGLAGYSGIEHVGWADSQGIHATAVSDQVLERIKGHLPELPPPAGNGFRPPLPPGTDITSQLFFLPGPPQKQRKGSSHRKGWRHVLFLTNTQPAALGGFFRLRLDRFTRVEPLTATGFTPLMVVPLGNNEVLLYFGPGGLPPGMSIALQIDSDKPAPSTASASTPRLFVFG
jgi:hypothetical protein